MWLCQHREMARVEGGREVASVWFWEHSLFGVLQRGPAGTTHTYSASGTGECPRVGQGLPKQGARSPPQCMAVGLWLGVLGLS